MLKKIFKLGIILAISFAVWLGVQYIPAYLYIYSVRTYYMPQEPYQPYETQSSSWKVESLYDFRDDLIFVERDQRVWLTALNYMLSIIYTAIIMVPGIIIWYNIIRPRFRKRLNPTS